MALLATWIRASDDAIFARWFERRPGVHAENARVDAGADAAQASGLLVTGGPDVSAEFLRQPIPNPALIEDAQPERDRWEFAAVQTALSRGLPIFAICKGMQILNVALGGTLHLDIPGHDLPESKDGNIQPLRYAAGPVAGPKFERVNSSHHQALDDLGEGLEVEAWCASDGIVEQVRLRNYPYCLGVQYHPERHEQYAAFFDEFLDRVLAFAPARTAAPL